jgi:hypothetical protein
MFCDYGAEWPLWDVGMVDPVALGLSPALVGRLRVWTDFYLDHARPDRGWLVSNERDFVWLEEGRRLSRHIERELGGAVVVEYTGL